MGGVGGNARVSMCVSPRLEAAPWPLFGGCALPSRHTHMHVRAVMAPSLRPPFLLLLFAERGKEACVCVRVRGVEERHPKFAKQNKKSVRATPSCLTGCLCLCYTNTHTHAR